MSDIIEVVSAAIMRIDDGVKRLLLAQRGPGAYAWQWCTPGGKVNSGESHLGALEREVFEELGPFAKVYDFGGPLYVYEHTHDASSKTPGLKVRVTCYQAIAGPLSTFVPQLEEHIFGVGWFTAQQLYEMRSRLAPADHHEWPTLYGAAIVRDALKVSTRRSS